VLGQLDKFEEAVHLVIRDVSFDKDIVVSVFETNIRMLGYVNNQQTIHCLLDGP